MKFSQQLSTNYLTLEEETSLFENYKLNNCLKSAETLVLSHLRFVAKMTNNYRNSKVDSNDLFQEGVIGLMKAIKSFDLSHKVRLIVYAVPYIKSAMMECVIHHIGIIKILTTKPHRKLFFNLNKLRGDKDTLSQSDIKRISEKLNVSEYDVVDIDTRLSNTQYSIDAVNENDDSIFHDILKDPNDTSYIALREQDEKTEAMYEALQLLSEREKYIFLSRNLTDNVIQLKELSEELGISIERVRQINERAFEKVQKYVLTKFED